MEIGTEIKLTLNEKLDPHYIPVLLILKKTLFRNKI